MIPIDSGMLIQSLDSGEMLIYQAAGHSLMTTRASAFCSSTPSPPPPPPPPPSRSLQRTTAISSLSSSSLDEFDVLLASSTAAAPPALDEARWSLLERFSRITRFYRNFFEYVPFYSSSATHEKLAAPSQDVFQEFEPARRYLETVGRSSQAAATSSSESCKDLYNRRKRPSIIVDKRTGIWEETVQAVTQVGTFEILSTDFTPPPSEIERQAPMNREEWQSLFNKYIPDSVNIQIHHNPDTTISINNSDFPNDADALNSGRIIVSEADVRDRIFKGGVVPEIRFEVWKFLLNVYPWDSTWIQRQHIRAENVKIYQQLKERCRYLQENLEMIEKEKRKGTKLDKETTKFLDGYFRIERDVIRTDRTHPFYAPPDNLAVNTAIATATTSSPSASNHPTSSNLPSSLSLSADLQQCIRNLRKLENILMAYSIWPDNPNSYVQGMADLASPLLIAMNGDEVDAFFCLAKLMEMMTHNFRDDGQGMHQHLVTLSKLIGQMFPSLYQHLERIDGLNLFCSFRWLLILFKREFEMEECSRLWEVIWAKGFHCNLKIELPVASSSSSGYSGEKDVAEDDAMKLNQHKEWDFVYFFALAVFERSEEELKSKCSAFDELLKFSNELSCRISLDTILERAEALRLRFRVKAASVTDSFSSSTDLLSVLNKIESLSKV